MEELRGYSLRMFFKKAFLRLKDSGRCAPYRAQRLDLDVGPSERALERSLLR